MGLSSAKLIRNPEWVKHRKEIFDRYANQGDNGKGKGTKRTRRGIGQLGHQPD